MLCNSVDIHAWNDWKLHIFLDWHAIDCNEGSSVHVYLHGAALICTQPSHLVPTLVCLVPRVYNAVHQEPQPFCQADTRFQLVCLPIFLTSALGACSEWVVLGNVSMVHDPTWPRLLVLRCRVASDDKPLQLHKVLCRVLCNVFVLPLMTCSYSRQAVLHQLALFTLAHRQQQTSLHQFWWQTVLKSWAFATPVH